MKKLITLAFCLYVMPGLFAQNIQRYDINSPWFFGLNVGAAWNSTDIENETNAGWGFTFGRSFATRPDAIFAWDLRLRYLQGNWYGQDYDTTNLNGYSGYTPSEYQSYADNPGYTVNNFSARNHHLGLELVLHANRLRQRTGWDPYIFGGANITWNQTYSDLVDIDSSFGISGQYDYDPSTISDGFLGSTILDGVYETPMNQGSEGGDYNLNFMPSLGVGIAYYPGPRFALGLEHMSTFTRKDDWDGYVDPTPGLWNRRNDIYHYTNFFLRFHLRGQNSVDPTPDPIANCWDPIIQLQRPNVSNTTVENQVFAFRAQIENINSIQNVRVRVNGVESSNFFYSTTTQNLEGSVVLQQGANTIQVVASNSCGSDMETVTINYNPCRAPIVRFTDPSQNNINVDNPVYRVRASIANGGSISYTINGAASSNFFYQQGNGSFESTVNLREGTNTITITTTNDCGSDTETITIVYTDCEDPRINFLSGNGSVINVSSPSALVRATIFGIEDRNAIGFRVNGANRTFNYNAGTRQLESNVSLSSGANRIEITVGNDCGTDIESMTVNYTPCTSPTVNILTPVRSGITNASGTQLIEASVTNATNVNQIQMLVNGVQVAGGNFNPVSRIYTNNAALNSGTNIIQIIVTNDCGSDSETTNVMYEVNCPVPMISLASTISTTHQSTLPIQYVVQNVSSASQITLRLNGVPVQGGFFNNQTNVFSATLGLTEGANTITINATNNCGQDSETIVVYYTQPCDDPIIAMFNPIGSQLSVTDAQFDVQAILQNVSNANQVQLTVNGTRDVSGSYNHLTQVYHNTINLQQGSNTIVMTVDNGCSTETEIFVIDYSPCLQPVVSIATPNGGSTQNANTVVTATVLNVASANDIEVIVNGVVYQGSYNATSGALSANVPLNSGSNSIQVVATNECGTISQTTNITYAPCTAPSVQFVTTPRGLRNTQSMNIEAQVTGVSGANEITATHNGNTVIGTYNASTNIYSFTITLANGLNTITVTASNECGSDAQSTTINYVEPCDAPQVSITTPANGSNAANATVQLSASILNVTNANQVQLLVNGNTQSGNLNVTTGVFTATVNLQQGANTIQVIATSNCGSASEMVTVLYRPCLAPTVQLVAPQAGTTQNGTTMLQAVITNVGSANDISLTVNGSPVSGSYNTTSNMFTANITLTNGANNIVVSANNQCGSDSKSVSVTYDEPCLSPQVSISSPSNNAQVATNSVQIAATIVNISTAGEVQLLVNGATLQGSYNATTNVYSATVPVQNGNNIIEIIASNDCGTATETVNVTYRPCVTPGIQIVSPLQTTTTNANVNLQAVLSGVTSANDVTVTLNGTTVSGSFNTTTHIYSAALTLTNGNNTIEITATNSCGSDSHTRTITYNEPCTTPQVSFNSPVNGSTVNTNSVQVSATVTGATGAGNVQLTVNGIPQYIAIDVNTGAMNANISLNQGVNAIVLSATNACGTTTETLNVTYTPCVPPSIQIASPQGGNTTNQTVTVVANVSGVERAAAIQTTLNGSGITGGVYDENAGTYTIEVTLQSGTNTVVIEAGNECGVNGATLQLIYDEPCDVPTISIQKPANNFETAASQVGLTAIITNITNAQEVQVTVSGEIVSGGSFDNSTKLYTTSIPLSRPINKIIVTATNKCGTESATVIVSQVTEATMVICNPTIDGGWEEIEIPVSQWSQYQANGATQGTCRAGGGNLNQGGSGSGSTQQGSNSGGTQSNTYGGQTGGGLIPGGGGGTTTVGGGGNTGSGSGTTSGGTTGGSTGGTTGGNNGGTNTGGGTSGGSGGSGNGGRDANTNGSGTIKGQQQAAQEAAAKKAAQEAAAKKAAQEAAAKKAAQEAAAKKAAQEAAAKKAAQEAAAKKAAQEAAAKKAAQEAAAKKAAQEAAAKKAAQEAAAKKAAQEAAAKKAAQEAAAKKAAQEAAAKKAAQEAAAKKAAQEAAAKKAAQEAAAKKAAQEAAAKKAAQEAAAKKAAQEAAAKKAAQEAAAKKAAQEAAAKKAAQEAAAKKAAQEAAAKKAAQEAAAKKAAQEAAKKKAAEEAAKKKAEEEKKKKEEEEKKPSGRTPTSTRGGGGNF